MTTISLDGLTGDSLVRHYQTALEIISEASECRSSEITIDLTSADWFTPAFLTPISVFYNQLNSSGIEIDVRLPSHTGIRVYLGQIGFPSGSENPSQQYDNHLPLCKLNTNSDSNPVETVGRKLRSILKEHYPDFSAGQVQGIGYPISEIVDNVDQHSECGYGSILVQNYKSKDYLDICIVDDGVSIPGKFDEYGIDYRSDEEALRMAMQGEVSTRDDEGHRHGGWGIRSTINLVCEGLNGKCLISSREGTITKECGSSPQSIVSSYSWDGTTFIGRIDIPDQDFNVIDYVTPESA